MAPRKKTDRITIHRLSNLTILEMDPIEIWDGADLSLVRDMLVHVIEKEDAKAVAVDMSYVKYIPSGFFGMLYDWFEKGIRISLIKPQENVTQMLWFKCFFTNTGEGMYLLHRGKSVAVPKEDNETWESQSEMISEHASSMT